MKAANALPKSLYSQLYHVTCVAHLLRNYAMKIRSHFLDSNSQGLREGVQGVHHTRVRA